MYTIREIFEAEGTTIEVMEYTDEFETKEDAVKEIQKFWENKKKEHPDYNKNEKEMTCNEKDFTYKAELDENNEITIEAEDINGWTASQTYIDDKETEERTKELFKDWSFHDYKPHSAYSADRKLNETLNFINIPDIPEPEDEDEEIPFE